MNSARYDSLRGKAVLITGGATGIGECIARAFHAQASRVAILDYDGEAGRALCSEVGEGVHFELCDVRDLDGLQVAIRRASAAIGPISVLVNNAARDDRHTIEQVTPEYWRERFATNLDHQFFAAQAVLPDMDKLGGGSIVNVGSTSYLASDDSFAAYKTAKSAVVGLTKALARELGGRGVRVNCVIPGWIMTQRQIDLWLTPEGETELLRR
jgi:NAD(P)-dependent dehydrogenase (short-subunit alcohol dehydrogenase family)